MSGNADRSRDRSVDPSDDSVGYCRPPKATRFKKGQSGNPRGRPKGAKNRRPALNEERMKSLILEEAYRDITIRDGDKTVTVPMIQAILRSLAINALKGQSRAQRLFADLLTMTESQNKALHDQWMQVAIEYKIGWEEELSRRAELGITGPEPLPHPDHVIINMREGTVEIKGPLTAEEKATYDMLVKRKQDFEEEIAAIRVDLASEADEGIRRILMDDLRQAQKVLGIISRAIS